MTDRTVRITRYPEGAAADDAVALEEPLEIRVDGTPLAVLMRTPGADRDLAGGFLLTEGVIDGPDDLTAIAPCADPNKPHAENTMMVALAAGCRLETSRLEQARRSFFASSSCGLCGRATIENLERTLPPRAAFSPIDRTLIETLETQSRQPGFARTGGLHAAVLYGPDGAALGAAEDIGRHNAVDKVIGARLLADALPLHGHTLWISGRAGFEVVQKALVARASGLIAVGAPSSLAVDLAETGRLTLVGFARNGRFNVYAGSVR